MKRFLMMLAVSLMVVLLLAGCSNARNNTDSNDNKQLSIVATIYPEYDWVLNILGEKKDNAEVMLLVDNGTDLHSYEPTAKDMVTIAKCDVFIYVGGESDQWVEDALKQATNKNMQVVNLMDVMGDTKKEEELKEGMQTKKEIIKKEETEPEYDEHVWLSLKNTQKFVMAIADAVAKADAANADIYLANAKSYSDKLSALDGEYTKTVKNAKQRTLLFGDRFPFRYMTEDYGIDYYAAFNGCSAETEASFETIKFLAGKVDELNLKNVMIIENSDGEIARTIIKNTKNKNQKILILDSLQSVGKKDMESGQTYLKIMESNLNVIKEALQ
ncbi:MAG: zinc ABC transporter substrate-binding protein [Eubacteriaceae bacterium]|nr:zinc ABC transporter substrate-binding protein [Eubacteriaceae bacterium]